MAPTPLRLKKLFDEGAPAVKWIFAELKGEQTRHEKRIDTQVSALTTSAQYDRGAYRDDIARLRQETDEALGLIQKETDAAYGPSVRGIPGLIALSRQNAADIQKLIAFAEAHKNDIKVLRQDVGMCLELRSTVEGLKSTVDDMKTRQLTHI